MRRCICVRTLSSNDSSRASGLSLVVVRCLSSQQELPPFPIAGPARLDWRVSWGVRRRPKRLPEKRKVCLRVLVVFGFASVDICTGQQFSSLVLRLRREGAVRRGSDSGRRKGKEKGKSGTGSSAEGRRGSSILERAREKGREELRWDCNMKLHSPDGNET